jgi:phospholipid/cholesterol/gamma-HCH transport system ATP-binding protein
LTTPFDIRTVLDRGTAGEGPPLVAGEVPVIAFDRVSLAFDEKVVLSELSFALLPGRMKIFLGASGSGKSTVLRLVLGLLKPDAGRVWVAGRRVDLLAESELMAVRAHLGMIFQEGALFDSLTVRENVGYRLYEESDVAIDDADARVADVLGFVGLGDFGARMPSELSGGQRRRVAIARAMTARPRILLYDEPTTGLDPVTAVTIDQEIVKLRDLEGVSGLLVTHQLRDAFYVATRQAVHGPDGMRFVPAPPEKAARTEFVMLRNGQIGFEGTADDLRRSTDSYLQSFLA